MIMNALAHRRCDQDRSRILNLFLDQHISVDFSKILKKYPRILTFKSKKNNSKDFYSFKEHPNLITLGVDLHDYASSIFQTLYKLGYLNEIKQIFKKEKALTWALPLQDFKKLEKIMNFTKTLEMNYFHNINSEFIGYFAKNDYHISSKIEGAIPFSSYYKINSFLKQGGIIDTDIVLLILNSNLNNWIETSTLRSISNDINYKEIINNFKKKEKEEIICNIDMNLTKSSKYLLLIKNDIIDSLNKWEYRKNLLYPCSIEQNTGVENLLNNNLNLQKFFKNRSLIKALYKTLLRKNKEGTSDFIYVHNFRYCYLVKKYFKSIDEQLLLPLTRIVKDHEFDIELFLSVAKLILKEKKIIKILSSQWEFYDDYYLNDCLIMYERIKKHPVKIPKMKSVKSFHDWLSLTLSKIEQVDFSLNQKIHVLDLDKMKIFNDTIVVPKSNHDLIDVGSKLHICVGNGYYAEKILAGEISIITIYQDQRLMCCLEFSDGVIIQMKGKFNKQISFSKEKTQILIDLLK